MSTVNCVEYLHAKIHVLFISDILNAIGFPDLLLLDLFTWIAAVGYIVAYKAINNKPPFPGSNEINALIEARQMQKLLHMSDHAVTSFLLLVTNYTSILEASFMAGDNPFGNALSVVGFATAGMQLASSNLAPRHAIENKVVNYISYATSAFALLNQVLPSGPI
ncbi:hypothetical protein A9Z42_0054930 [Trichoderma parareesei]|uniref:Uncharacterized protein n=1 Tax=Trichoderma parareesei TaxID=858221 RepID=A0A2H2ZJN0_TRIPA|nr:hypothetical protein A9Z42_0054930 [Trichoderma parareesei]